MRLSTLILSFTQHPRSYIEHNDGPDMLLTPQERRNQLLHTGVDRVHFFDFEAIQSLTAKAFLQHLHKEFQVDALLMGYDHRFGSDGLTELSDYQHYGDLAHIKILTAPLAPDGNVSSTKIRRALQEGRLSEANAFLGYPYTISGEVVHGLRLGTQIGFPTANLRLPKGKLVPAKGVYAALVGQRKAIVNIGTNPTFGEDGPLTIEVHIPHYVGDLYGQYLSVQLLEYIRPEVRFPNQQSLVEQIHQDLVHLDQLVL